MLQMDLQIRHSGIIRLVNREQRYERGILKLRVFSEAATQNIIVETARRSAINIHVLMAVLSTKMDMEFVPKQ